MPADLALCEPDFLPSEENNLPEYVLSQQEQFRKAYKIARDTLKERAQRRKSHYDAGVHPSKFEIGQKVWYFYPRRYVKRSRKWQFAYVGPYTVIKRLTDLTYIIQKSPHDKEIVAHVDKLKVCVGELTGQRSCQGTNNVCFVSFSMNKMDRNKKRHMCEECRQEFTRASGLRKHNECVHLGITWTSKLCEITHCSRSNLVRHLRLQHADVPNPPQPERDPIRESSGWVNKEIKVHESGNCCLYGWRRISSNKENSRRMWT